MEGACVTNDGLSRTLTLKLSAIQHPSGRRLLRSGGPNHSKHSCVLVFLHHIRLTLDSPLVLRIRWVHSTTRLEFTSDNIFQKYTTMTRPFIQVNWSRLELKNTIEHTNQGAGTWIVVSHALLTRLNLWIYLILSSLILMHLPMSTLVSHYYHALRSDYTLEVSIEYVQTISTGVGQVFL
jgi:hypothetical protein